MSDTTKINKVRVNGVLYDIAGSGGTGGVSGAWLAPGELIESGYIDADSESEWEYMTIDPQALLTQLEKAGIDVDESPFMDGSEHQIDLRISRYSHPNSSENEVLIDIEMDRSTMRISILNSYGEGASVYPSLNSLRQLIYNYFSNVTDLYCNVPEIRGFSTLANYIQIQYDAAHTTLKYYIPDMSEFCEEVFVEYNSSSES